MKLRIERFFNIRKIKDIWLKLYEHNPKLSPLQNYHYVANYCNLGLDKRGRYNVFYVLYQEEENGIQPLMICPLSTSILFRKSRGYEVLGGRESDISNFIYSEALDVDTAKQCIEFLLEHIGTPLRFRRLDGSSLIFKALESLYPNLEMTKQTYLKIPNQSDIDEYIAGLSKSTRQNIRTAYNRMNRDEIKFSLEIAYPTSKNIKLYEDGLSAYVDRQIQFYKKSTILGSKALTYLYYKTFDSESKSLKDLSNSFTAVLKLNDKTAGVMMAFSKDNFIVVPRLAIDSSFNFYSPGVILIVETLRYMLAQTELNSIDLSLGNEKYKYSMGGEEYFAYDLFIPNQR